jgi:hypothetical protein
MQNSATKFLLYKNDTSNLAWGNYTKQNHLYYNGLIQPAELAQKPLQFVSTTKSLSRGITPLLDLTKGQGKTIKIGQDEWTWKLYGMNCRPAVVLEDIEPTNNVQGIQHTKFKIKLDAEYFVVGDILAPKGPKKFQARVQEEPMMDGGGWIYTMQLITDDPTMYLPKKFTRAGEQWKKLFSTYGEGRIDAGSTYHSEMPYFVMQSWLSHVAKKYKVTGDAASSVLVAQPNITDTNGKLVPGGRYWTYTQEAIFDRQWKQDLENLITYSRSTKKVIDESTGNMVRQGPGLQELLEEGNVHYYNKFSVKLVSDFLSDIFFNRVSFKDRNIVMLSGQVGCEMWSEAIAKIANGKFSDMSSMFIKEGAGDRSQGGNLIFGNNYKTYNMLWGSLTVVHYPIYDDIETQTEINPMTGRPAESQRFTFLNLGLGDGFANDNLQFVERERGESYGYRMGTFGPYGPTTNEAMAHTGDFYEVIRTKKCGIQLTDPKLTGELIFNLQY